MPQAEFRLIQSSLEVLQGSEVRAIDLFLQRLVQMEPQSTTSFPEQRRLLRELARPLLRRLIEMLDHPDAIQQIAEWLGGHPRLANYVSERYEAIGNALLMTLESVLGAAFSHELEDAWADLYVAVVNQQAYCPHFERGPPNSVAETLCLGVQTSEVRTLHDLELDKPTGFLSLDQTPTLSDAMMGTPFAKEQPDA
jgi:hemoglobin-like flavoprotein